MPYPPRTHDVHHEMELVAALRSGGLNMPESDALQCVWGYAAGLDMTRRDVQGEARKLGRPSDMGKGFDHSAPIGDTVPRSSFNPEKGRIELRVNGVIRQESDISMMIWNLAETISHLSRLVRLDAGDLSFTGTPEGVTAVQPGDLVVDTVTGLPTL